MKTLPITAGFNISNIDKNICAHMATSNVSKFDMIKNEECFGVDKL